MNLDLLDIRIESNQWQTKRDLSALIFTGWPLLAVKMIKDAVLTAADVLTLYSEYNLCAILTHIQS